MLVCLPLFGCLQSSYVWSHPPPKKSPSSPPPLFFTQPRCCTVGNTFHPKTRHTPNSFHPSPLLSHQPYTIIHAPIWCRWKIAINRAARGVFVEWVTFGFLSSVCDDAVWAVLDTPSGQQLRTRPDFPVSADLQVNADPACCP